MFKVLPNNDIEMVKGDTLSIFLSLTNDDGSVYTPTSGDSIHFYMNKPHAKSGQPVLIDKEIDTDTLNLYLESSDTKQIPAGIYVYDIEITHADGFVDTFIPHRKITLIEEVG